MTCCELTLFVYVLWVHVVHINSTKASYWKLNVELGQIVYLEPADCEKCEESSHPGDSIFSILTSRHFNTNVFDKVENNSNENCDINCSAKIQEPSASSTHEKGTSTLKSGVDDLNCGDDTLNYTTQYDNLSGIFHRSSHPQFTSETDPVLNVSSSDVDQLAKKLNKAKKNKPHSAYVFAEVGNVWLARGNVHRSLECFRRALFISPNNSMALLYLARLLLSLHYTDDAIWLTRRSLDASPADHNPWMQHFTMGELYRSKGKYRESASQFKLSLAHNPGFHLANVHIKEVEGFLESTVHMYTLFVALLALGAILGILTTLDVRYVESLSSNEDPLRCQRHFNRAMAMRSIRMSISTRSLKLKRSHFIK